MLADILALALGLAWGSFCNVVITRLPVEESVIFGRSHCRHCHQKLFWYDNLPLLSYFLLKGRCRFCGARIPWHYPAMELAGGLLALALWRQFPFAHLLVVYGPFALALLLLAGLDLEHWWLPDSITYPVTAYGLGMALFLPHLTFLESLSGAAAGAVFFAAIRWGYKHFTGRDGLGGGDVKLLALIGAFLGIEALPLILLLSAGLGSVAGVILARRSGQGRLTAVPYGVFLALAGVIYLFGEDYFTWF
jgi:leader peptidase (prepilin peptidase) / N-methyltransferase